jgi:DNA-damage-inducible protein D
MSPNPSAPHTSPFEAIKKVDPDTGAEFWSSRDFAKVLGYDSYRNFEPVIEKAKIACDQSGHKVVDHFVDSHTMITLGKGGQREVKIVLMSRYACYLAIQNADPHKEIVAAGQTYFAVQTRRQELSDEDKMLEDQRRLLIRRDIRLHNAQLANAAMQAGVVEPRDYAIFMDHGYRGLYGGMGQTAIHKQKGLKKSQKILDHMGSEELSDNWFARTQAEAKIRREGIQGKEAANKVHHDVSAEVRDTIKKLGGTMPEDLPTPPDSIQQLEAREKKKKKLLKPKNPDQLPLPGAEENIEEDFDDEGEGSK